MMSVIAASASNAPMDRIRDAAAPLKAFLIPSVFGDEPQLQDLRRRLQDTISFDLLAMPDVGARGSLLTDMAATGQDLVGEILRRSPAGPLALVGYSFGASMALEVAAQLSDVGREVVFLAVLDGPFEPPKVGQRQSAGVPPAGSRKLLKFIVVNAIRSMGFIRLLVARATPSKPAADDRMQAVRRAMLWHLRNKALTNWKPRGCSAPGLHISTGDYGPANRARWAELCPNLHHVEVSAVHEDLLKRGALKAVSSLLKVAVHTHRT